MEDEKRVWIYNRVANGDPELMEAQRMSCYAMQKALVIRQWEKLMIPEAHGAWTGKE
ncbi:hypothetical protein UF75_3547 [Desulfosporosinus sp. I2]|uniref:hypothetical protein n=1 Tax=Desulfosporosinus sp. I2 TaxID=1617025 RepID=UPI00061FAB9D|nr:hypothetical protein [Desulfosporosinus sp. I2]KJR46057.1 hypothetical protein UF75_3547 [Desulfosporosinus sp. I2]